MLWWPFAGPPGPVGIGIGYAGPPGSMGKSGPAGPSGAPGDFSGCFTVLLHGYISCRRCISWPV
jgi:hypothetical protein